MVNLLLKNSSLKCWLCFRLLKLIFEKWQIKMLIVFSPNFVVGTSIIFGYDFGYDNDQMEIELHGETNIRNAKQQLEIKRDSKLTFNTYVED